MSTEITAHMILPARREPIELKTADGSPWSASWRCPRTATVATLVTFHRCPPRPG